MSPFVSHRIEHHDHLPAEHIPALRDLLQATDHEFVPHLSSRTSSTQTQLIGETAQEPSVEPYLEALLTQRFIIATDAETSTLSAFMSYKPHYAHPNHPAGLGHYVTTTIVHPQHRRHKLAATMYKTMIDQARTDGALIIARTWSTNYPRLRLADTLGFTVDAHIEDDRGPGIDTVYLSWRPAPLI